MIDVIPRPIDLGKIIQEFVIPPKLDTRAIVLASSPAQGHQGPVSSPESICTYMHIEKPPNFAHAAAAFEMADSRMAFPYKFPITLFISPES